MSFLKRKNPEFCPLISSFYGICRVFTILVKKHYFNNFTSCQKLTCFQFFCTILYVQDCISPLLCSKPFSVMQFSELDSVFLTGSNSVVAVVVIIYRNSFTKISLFYVVELVLLE